MSPRLGIDLGGTKIHAAVIAPDGLPLGEARLRTLPEEGYDAVLARIADAARQALDAAGLGIDELAGIGLGVPGPVDAAAGVILLSPNLRWQRRPVAQDLARLLGRVPALDSDVNCAALGEAVHGAAAGRASAAVVFVGTGLGAALVVGGRTIVGANGSAGEIGHLRAPFDQVPCGCGRPGCLEITASKRGIARMLRDAVDAGRPCLVDLAGPLRSSALREAVDAGCAATRAAVERAAAALGWGLAAVEAVADPEAYVLGGGVVEALGDAFVERVDRAFRAESLFAARGRARVLRSALGDRAVAVGAALLQRGDAAPAGARSDRARA